jgi:hypothetical protein
MNNELKTRWLAALRGDEYKQVDTHLRTENGHCCLGVLCDISGLGEWSQQSPGDYIWSFTAEDDQRTFLPPTKVLAEAGLTRDVAETLSHMNDEGKSFGVIADYIEANV